MLRIYFYFFVSINFLALSCLFILNFLNVIFIREEFIDIPEIKSSNKENFVIPDEVKNDNYNFKILKHDDDNFLNKLNSKNTEFEKNTDNQEKNLSSKKSISKNEINNYIVQLGVFKNKNYADNQLLTINNHKKKLFKDVEINIFKTKNKKNTSLYYVETNAITKINAINLCDFFKNKKINCIIKIKK